MPMHPTTYDALAPSVDQLARILALRKATKAYADVVESIVPEGKMRDRVLIDLLGIESLAIIAVTREDDGTPREGATVP